MLCLGVSLVNSVVFQIVLPRLLFLCVLSGGARMLFRIGISIAEYVYSLFLAFYALCLFLYTIAIDLYLRLKARTIVVGWFLLILEDSI